MVVALAHVRLPQINHDPQWVLMMHKPTMTLPILVGIQRRSTFCNIALATCRIATQVHICVTKRLKARTPTGTTPALAAGVTGTKLRLVGGTQTAHDGVCRQPLRPSERARSSQTAGSFCPAATMSDTTVHQHICTAGSYRPAECSAHRAIYHNVLI